MVSVIRHLLYIYFDTMNRAVAKKETFPDEVLVLQKTPILTNNYY